MPTKALAVSNSGLSVTLMWISIAVASIMPCHDDMGHTLAETPKQVGL